MNYALYSSATRAAQAAMSMFTPLTVDGKWGRFTQGAYDALSQPNRDVVDRVVSAQGAKVSELRAFREAERAGLASPRVREFSGAVNSAIADAAARTGVPAEALTTLVRIESGGNPRAVNGSSKGLLQFQRAAWEDMRKKDSSIGDYDSNVFDPVRNARAGALYYRTNQLALSRLPGMPSEVEPAYVYMAHQQGLAGFTDLWNTARGNPGKSYVTAAAMEKNPPPDKKGVTTDKKEFLQRWVEVVRKRMKG